MSNDDASLFDDDHGSQTSSDAFSVSQLTNQIKYLLETQFDELAVEGEISNFRPAPSGHAYFTLKDANAQLSCVMFRGNFSKINFKPKDGQKVRAEGRISVYAPRGNYQFIISKMTEHGVGDLHQQFIELKNKLEKQGLFDPSHKKEIPFLPRRIGVVTSPTGAAIRDILNVLGRRFANLEIIIYSARVQGEYATGEIVRGIQKFNELENIDVMIIGRGGGSIEDLWCFNEEKVARAIFASNIPIISAVGHEIDFTISDFTADLRVPTPSAAAEIVSQNQQDLIDRVSNFNRRLDRAILNVVDQRKAQLKNLQTSYAMRRPLDRIRETQQRLDDANQRLEQTLTTKISQAKQALHSFSEKLEALNPTAILQRGYSIVYIKHADPDSKNKFTEEILRKSNQAKPNQKMRIVTSDGELPATANPPIKAEQGELF